jgi:capsular polysaccharide transport system permease protein
MRDLAVAVDLIWALTWRQFTPRNRREGFRLLWIFLEPIGQTAVLMIIFALIGRAPSYGDSFALFLLTGIIVLTAFSDTSMLVRGAISGAAAASRPPALGLFHNAIAQVVFKAVVVVLYTATLLWAVGVVERVPTAPAHPERLVAALALTMLMSFGVGLLRAWAMIFLPAVERVYAILTRALLFISGVFYVPSFMPPQLRDLLAWNPVLHAVELVRLGVYEDYPSIVFSADYLTGVALGVAALGVGLLWMRRARLMG